MAMSNLKKIFVIHSFIHSRYSCKNGDASSNKTSHMYHKSHKGVACFIPIQQPHVLILIFKELIISVKEVKYNDIFAYFTRNCFIIIIIITEINEVK